MDVLAALSEPSGWLSLVTLAGMEIVLGMDNIVFLSIMVAKLPAGQQAPARTFGLALALLSRLALLFTISWVMGLQAPLFTAFGHTFSWRDLILVGGGLFLIGKSTHEMFEKLEIEAHEEAGKAKASFVGVVLQITVLDIVFSLDSVITAVGMASHVSIMAIAIIIAMLAMLIFAGRIGKFVNDHPSMKILALSFLLLIGVVLVAEGIGQHISKGYIYFAMAFSLGVELMNMKLRLRNRQPLQLHGPAEVARSVGEAVAAANAAEAAATGAGGGPEPAA